MAVANASPVVLIKRGNGHTALCWRLPSILLVRFGRLLIAMTICPRQAIVCLRFVKRIVRIF